MNWSLKRNFSKREKIHPIFKNEIRVKCGFLREVFQDSQLELMTPPALACM